MTDREVVGSAVPQTGSSAGRWFGQFLLRVLGWRIEGHLPNKPKMLVVVAPHTSNWDFIIGILAVLGLGLDARWIAKHTLFESPLGPLLRRLGGMPVDRSAAHGVVDQIVSAYKNEDTFLLGITPEGTRKKVPRWKSGFYHIARKADVPLVPISLDYQSRTITILPVFPLTSSYEHDLELLQSLYSKVVPKHPENFNYH